MNLIRNILVHIIRFISRAHRHTGRCIAIAYLHLWNVSLGKNLKLYTLPYCRTFGSGRIVIGNNVRIANKLSENPSGIVHRSVLCAHHGALITIGDNTGMSGSVLYGSDNITIGQHCLLGANSRIFTTDFHPLRAQDRVAKNTEATKTAPVVLEDCVWIGTDVIILKGVTVGRNSVIAAGSIVTKDIPSNVLAAGAPARVIKNL